MPGNNRLAFFVFHQLFSWHHRCVTPLYGIPSFIVEPVLFQTFFSSAKACGNIFKKKYSNEYIAVNKMVMAQVR